MDVLGCDQSCAKFSEIDLNEVKMIFLDIIETIFDEINQKW